MNHHNRTLERNATGTWSRTCKSYFHFTPKESRKLKCGGIVEKWGAMFRLRRS